MGIISEVIIQDILNCFFDKAKKFIQEKFQALNDKNYGINIFNIDAVRKLLHDAIQNSSKNDSLKNEEIKELLSDNYLSVFAWILEGTSFSNDLININNYENKNNQMDFMKTVQKYIYENRLNDEKLLPFITYFNSKKELEKTNSIEELIKKNTPSLEWPTEVMNIKEFIRTYDCNKQVAPLELDFLFREKEIAQINDVLNNNDAIILKGKPGCGKTRLAIETAKRLSSKNLYEVFCIRELNDDSFTNFKIKIEENKKYLLIIDDVNLFDEKILTKLFQFTLENTKGCKFKFILTLRDSFYETISYFCSQHLSFQTLIIDNFNDEQITVFLDKTFGIKNQKYINQIIRICEGNPRLAYFAGFYAIKKNSLASIVNSTQLFHSYYGLFFDKIGLFKNENLLKTAGILSLFRQIDTTKLSNYTDILNLCNITESDFIESCHQLVKIEIAENRFSTIFKISEQCLENYFLYIFLLEKKYISFSKIIMLLFEKDPNFIIDRINTIFPIFYSEQSYDYIKNEINYIWTSMLEKDCSYNFVKAFHSFNITEAICYAKSLVDSAKESKIDVNTIHFDENSNYVDNKILNLLGSFSDSEEIKSTIQLMLRYIKKDEKSILDGFNEIKIRFSVNEQSLKDDFKRENILLETLLEEKNSSEILTILFLQVSKLFLNLVFQPTKEERKFSITIVTINLPCTTGSKKYRELIWNELKKLLSKNLYVNYIINILETYTSNWPDEYNKDILEFDKPHILELINMLPNAQWPFIVKIKRELNKKWEKYNISRTNISRRRIGEENIEIYDLFTSTNNYDEAYEKKIIKYKKEHPDINCDKIIQILDEIINNYPTLFDRIYYNFFTFINYLDKDELIEIILSCLKRKSKLLIPISRFVERLFIITSKKEAYDFICNTNLPNKNLWKFYYFAIPENNKQTKKDYEEFLNILEEGYQEDNYFKNLSFSLTYVKYDSNAIVNIFTKILNFNLPENNLAQIYLNLFFENNINPKQLAKYFKSNKELLFKIYLMGTKHIDIFDYNGNYLYYLLENEEDFIPRYAEEMINKISKYEDLRHDISRIWDCKNYTNIMKTIMEIARKKELYNSGNLKVLFTSGDNKATSWLLSEIKEHNDNDNYMILLFNIISELSESQRLDCIKQFIENNNDVDLFKKLSLAPSSMSTSGSFVPIYQSIVIYLQKVKDIIPDGINYIEHKKHIESLINEWKQRIESQRKHEYINEIYFN